MTYTPRGERPSGTRGRDANLGRATRVTGWVTAGSLALAGILSAVAAQAFPGRAAASTSAGSSQAGSSQAGSSQAGAVSSAPSPATSAPANNGQAGSSQTSSGGDSSQASSAGTTPLQPPSQAPVPTRRAPLAVSAGS